MEFKDFQRRLLDDIRETPNPNRQLLQTIVPVLSDAITCIQRDQVIANQNTSATLELIEKLRDEVLTRDALADSLQHISALMRGSPASSIPESPVITTTDIPSSMTTENRSSPAMGPSLPKLLMNMTVGSVREQWNFYLTAIKPWEDDRTLRAQVLSAAASNQKRSYYRRLPIWASIIMLVDIYRIPVEIALEVSDTIRIQMRLSIAKYATYLFEKVRDNEGSLDKEPYITLSDLYGDHHSRFIGSS